MKYSPISYILSIGLSIAYWEYVKVVLVVILLAAASKYTLKIVRFIHRLANNRRLVDVDTMDGVDFERYIADVLRGCGYHNVSLTEQYDYGVDIVAEKDGIRWGIQTKRYSGLVKADAVRQVVTGLPLYGCNRAMVITNSVFSNVAIQLAEGNECVLIDRQQLAKLIG